MLIFVDMIGVEAQLWLRHCLEGGVLEDPAVDYLAEKVDGMDAAALMEAMGLIRKRLAEIEVLEGTDEGEKILVTRDYRILLPERFNTEIRMRPLVKTVFLLFLRHPEGIRFGDLPAYRNEMMDLYRGITRRAGGPEIEALEGTDDGERILVTRDYRILLPDRFGMEIRLRPLVKTVFLLFLRHPEGIRFGNLRDYRQELMDLYQGITRRGDLRQIAESVDRLVDPKDNSIHEKAANLSAALSRYFKPQELPAYVLTGKAGAPKRIRLDRSRVEWE